MPTPRRFTRMLPPALLLASLVGAPLVLAEVQAPEPVVLPGMPVLDPVAMQALQRMGAYLRTLDAFSLHIDDATDEVLDSGQKIQLIKRVELQVRRPDRLRADVETDRKARAIYYDGKTFTLVAPEVRYYASVPAPPTIREVLDKVQTKFDIEFPLADLFYWGGEEDDAAAIQDAMHVGTSRIAGQLADHYAFRQADVDWQIWIAQGDAPLPLRYVITTKDVPGEPQFVASLTWDTTTRPDEAAFTFIPTKADHPIMIVTTDSDPATN
ncbi:DUF2092 domain-containing protein [Thiocystis violascens]|uniref:Putative periplasmic protein n=1 Tax=Thiocystis violascens (strain ATCC 17096 / DSM 198 / 6111) TaxID=765911 RepID=I3YEV3_THIV6|nr:DUF2092 domain-containing protein [Thiocystis violascens]AFL75521.1 putative periplasmic protein [Thiocystis violascens DSM 198]